MLECILNPSINTDNFPSLRLAINRHGTYYNISVVLPYIIVLCTTDILLSHSVCRVRHRFQRWSEKSRRSISVLTRPSFPPHLSLHFLFEGYSSINFTGKIVKIERKNQLSGFYDSIESLLDYIVLTVFSSYSITSKYCYLYMMLYCRNFVFF